MELGEVRNAGELGDGHAPGITLVKELQGFLHRFDAGGVGTSPPFRRQA
jgi:hypothetical protein